MALGHYQKVHRGLRGDVVEGEHVVVFVDFLGRDFTLDDFAEKTVFTHSSYKVVKRRAARLLEGRLEGRKVDVETGLVAARCRKTDS